MNRTRGETENFSILSEEAGSVVGEGRVWLTIYRFNRLSITDNS